MKVRITDTGVATGNPAHTTTVTRTINVSAAAGPASAPAARASSGSPSSSRSSRRPAASPSVVLPGPVDDDLGRDAQRHLAAGLRADLHDHRADDRRAGRALHRPQLDDAARRAQGLLGQHRLDAARRGPGPGAARSPAAPSRSRAGRSCSGCSVRGSVALELGEDAGGTYLRGPAAEHRAPGVVQRRPRPPVRQRHRQRIAARRRPGVHYNGLKSAGQGRLARQAEGPQRLLLLHPRRRYFDHARATRRPSAATRAPRAARRRSAVHPVRHRPDHEPLGRQRGDRGADGPPARGLRRHGERPGLEVSARRSATSAGGSRSPTASISTTSRSGCASARRRSRSGRTSAPTSWGQATSSTSTAASPTPMRSDSPPGASCSTAASQSGRAERAPDRQRDAWHQRPQPASTSASRPASTSWAAPRASALRSRAGSTRATAQFVVGGDGQGCLGDACAEAEGELSSIGVAGCVTVGTSLPTYDLVIPLDGRAVHPGHEHVPVHRGLRLRLGRLHGGPAGRLVRLLALRADARLATRAAAGVTRSASRADRARHGRRLAARPRHPRPAEDRPPRTPRRDDHVPGARTRDAAQGPLPARGEQDGRDDQRDARPARPRGRGPSRPRRAPSRRRPRSTGRASKRRRRSGRAWSARARSRTAQVAYAVPAGTIVRLVERGKGINHILTAKRVRGRRCHRASPGCAPAPDEKILCANVRFRPRAGPGGKRMCRRS